MGKLHLSEAKRELTSCLCLQARTSNVSVPRIGQKRAQQPAQRLKSKPRTDESHLTNLKRSYSTTEWKTNFMKWNSSFFLLPSGTLKLRDEQKNIWPRNISISPSPFAPFAQFCSLSCMFGGAGPTLNMNSHTSMAMTSIWLPTYPFHLPHYM